MSTLVASPSVRRPASTTVACQLCGGEDFEAVARRDRRGEALTTVVCRGCGLVSHEQVPDDETLARYYAHEYRRDYHREFQPSARRVIREWRRGRALFERLRGHLLPGDRVLEIGSGIGCNLKPFELAGFETAGIEPGEGFCRYSRETLGCNVRQASLSDLPATPNYDFVLLVHVLEHLNQPRAALQKIGSMLRDGGRLYVEVPNLDAPHPSLDNITHFAHIFNFTPWTLAALGEVAGLETCRVLSQPGDRNLAILFRKGSGQPKPVPAGLYERTKATLDSFQAWSYYLRPGYVFDRIGRAAGQFAERIRASSRLERIVRECRGE